MTAIIEFAFSGKPSSAAKAAHEASSAGVAKSRKRSGEGSVDVRSTAGRAAYDASVLGAVRAAEGWISAQSVRELVGGTAAQARTALNRLFEAGKIDFKGKARATKYRVTSR